jgi:hypothetical protein
LALFSIDSFNFWFIYPARSLAGRGAGADNAIEMVASSQGEQGGPVTPGG